MPFLTEALLQDMTVAGVIAALLGTALVALGQYRCLSRLPRQLRARAKLVVSVFCLLTAAAVGAGSLYFAGGRPPWGWTWG